MAFWIIHIPAMKTAGGVLYALSATPKAIAEHQVQDVTDDIIAYIGKCHGELDITSIVFLSPESESIDALCNEGKIKVKILSKNDIYNRLYHNAPIRFAFRNGNIESRIGHVESKVFLSLMLRDFDSTYVEELKNELHKIPAGKEEHKKYQKQIKKYLIFF